MVDPIHTDLRWELDQLVRASSPNEVRWASSPVLRFCAESLTRISDEFLMTNDDVAAILSAAVPRIEIEPFRQAILSLFDWTSDTNSLAERSRESAARIGIKYDAFRRKNAEGQNRVDFLVNLLAKAILEIDDIGEILLSASPDVDRPSVTSAQSDAARLFMSYARADDEHEGWFFSKLREAVEREYKFQTGLKLSIFQDKIHMNVGENWRRRLNNEIDGTVLLLVILTPSYLASEICREELTRFFERESAMGREDLALAIYYQALPKETESEDELARHLLTRHYADWRPLRFEEFDSVAVKKEMANLVRHIVAALARADSPLAADAISQADVGQNNDRGILESLAEMDLALPRYARSVQSMARVQTEVNELVQARGNELNEAKSVGTVGNAKRLLVSRKLANDLEPKAEEMDQIRRSMQRSIEQIDEGVQAIIGAIPDSDEEDIEEAAAGMLDSIAATHDIMQSVLPNIGTLQQAYNKVAKQSKALRPVVTRLATAPNVVQEHATVFAGWGAGIEAALEARAGSDTD